MATVLLPSEKRTRESWGLRGAWKVRVTSHEQLPEDCEAPAANGSDHTAPSWPLPPQLPMTERPRCAGPFEYIVPQCDNRLCPYQRENRSPGPAAGTQSQVSFPSRLEDGAGNGGGSGSDTAAGRAEGWR